MTAHAGWDHVGADGQSYPEVAARAVQSVHAQHQSPVYGYLRSGAQQKIYLFRTLEDARGWFAVFDAAGRHMLQQPYDYAAVFAAPDLSRPVPGLESFGSTYVSGDAYVGQLWPFFLGLPLGALGGYFLHDPVSRWLGTRKGIAQVVEQLKARIPGPPGPEGAPAPKTVGGPWVDLVGQDDGYTVGGYDGYTVGGYDGYDGYTVGGPWLDIEPIGAQYDDRRRTWPQTRALIQSAIDEVRGYAASYPAEAYVWTLEAPGAPYAGSIPGSVVMLEGTTSVVPFSSRAQALDYLREVAQTRPVAQAMFERSSHRWPNPVTWQKSDEPQAEQVIAQHVASRSATRASGDYVGAWDTVVGTALDDVRHRAQSLAERRAGSVVGVVHTSKDGLWHTLAFRTSDDADDWLGTATHDPSSYTYAAYYDKDDYSWPHPVNEKIGGARSASRAGEPIRREIAATSGDGGGYDVGADVGADVVGAALDVFRSRARALATARPGKAAGVIRTSDGLWHALGFSSLDDSVDWLQTATRDKSSFFYAAIFEKAADGTAYFQDEEIGESRGPAPSGEPIRRGIATTSGDDYGWAV